MSRRKGLSVEEKRTRMLEIFYESKTFYNLKEIEKIASKDKGIVLQTVKDILQSLVDDGYVDSDKIGTSIYYWALPSKAAQIKKKRLADLEEKLEKVKESRIQMEKSLEQAQNLRKTDDPEENSILLAKISELQERKLQLEEKISDYKDYDPDLIGREKKEIQIFKDAANRWTDNIFSVRSWMTSKFNQEEAAINKHFGISEDLDYLD